MFWRNDATRFPVDYTCTAIKDEGDTVGAVVCFTDTTERRRVALALEASEAKFKAISVSAQDGIVMIDNDGNVTYWNPAAQTIFGRTSDEMLGRDFHEICVPIEYLEAKRKGFELFRSTGTGAAIGKTLEMSALRNDGTEFPVEVALSSVKLDGTWHAIGIIRDITARKEREAELRKLLFAVEQSANVVMITDLGGNLEYVNPRFTETSGYTADEVYGRNPRFLKSGEMSAAAYRVLWKTIASGETWNGEFHNRKKSGELYWERTTISPVFDEAGAVTNYVAIKEDITKEKEMAEQHKILEVEMNQARKLQAVGSLAAGIAHEINTPIQFVGDNVRFLSESIGNLLRLANTTAEFADSLPDDGRLKDTVEKLKAAIKLADVSYLQGEIPRAVEQTLDGVTRVTTIVQAMSDFSHPEQEDKSRIDLNRALKNTLIVAQNEFKYVADVITELDEDLPSVLCYPSDLNQVFLSLLVNAAHAIADVVGESGQGRGRGTITVSTRRDGDDVVVAIRDTGTGIPDDVSERIFEHFFTTKEVGSGAGQGLTLSRSIVVEKHGGNLTFETELRKGTTFYVTLPIGTESVEPATEDPSAG